MAEQVSSHIAHDLTRIHKVITRGLNVTREHGAVAARDGFTGDLVRQGYVDYAHALLITLRGHHDAEDTVVFPTLAPKMPEVAFEKLSGQHAQLIVELAEAQKAVDTANAGKPSTEWLDPLLKALGKVDELWRAHIAVEEPAFTPATLDSVLSTAEQAALAQAIGEHSQRTAQPGYLCMPFLLFNLEADDRAIFKRMLPAAVIDQLVPVTWADLWAPMKPFLLAENVAPPAATPAPVL